VHQCTPRNHPVFYAIIVRPYQRSVRRLAAADSTHSYDFVYNVDLPQAQRTGLGIAFQIRTHIPERVLLE